MGSWGRPRAMPLAPVVSTACRANLTGGMRSGERVGWGGGVAFVVGCAPRLNWAQGVVGKNVSGLQPPTRVHPQILPVDATHENQSFCISTLITCNRAYLCGWLRAGLRLRA